MSKASPPALTEDEIEEELLNNDLLNCGEVDEETLHQMDITEKKNLLLCLKKSKEDFHHETGTSSKPLKKPIVIDTTPQEFPALAPPPARGSNIKLKLPRKCTSGTKTESQDQCISLLDDEENEDLFTNKKKFSLPFCVSDGAPPLSINRVIRHEECPYYKLPGECAEDTLRRMLSHHDSWVEKYIAEMRKSQTRVVNANIQDDEDKGSRSDENDDSENDPYSFSEVTKVYSGPAVKKRETRKSFDQSPSQNSRPIQRKTSRDSDCEEVQPILKPEDPKLGTWLIAPNKNKPRNKRNRKQNSNQTKSQSLPDVEFEFENNKTLWGAGRSGGQPQSPAPSRRAIPMTSVPEVHEEKVQCPICQRNFTLSTVENHAATCEGFSSSPMDVEEGT